MTINLIAEGQQLSFVKKPETVKGTRGYITCRFSFVSDEWQSGKLRAMFKNSKLSDVYHCEIATDGTVVIPHEVLAEQGTVSIAAVAEHEDGVRVTTNAVCFYNDNTIYGEKETDPTPSEYMQVINAAEAAQKIAQSVRDDADSGKFNGKDGATGATGADGAPGKDGKDGTDGKAATISVGSVTTGEPGTSASVVNSGTENAAILDFLIPKGEKGESYIKVVTISDDTPVLLSENGLYYIHIDSTVDNIEPKVTLLKDEAMKNMRNGNTDKPTIPVDEGTLIKVNVADEEYGTVLVLGETRTSLAYYEFMLTSEPMWGDISFVSDYTGSSSRDLWQSFTGWEILLDDFSYYREDMDGKVVTVTKDEDTMPGNTLPQFTYTNPSELFPVDTALSTTSDNAVANSTVTKLLNDGHLTGIKIVYTTEELAALITEDNFKNPGDCLMFIVDRVDNSSETVYIEAPSGLPASAPPILYLGAYMLERPTTATTYSSDTLVFSDLAQISAVMQMAAPLLMDNQLRNIAQIIDAASYEQFVQLFTETSSYGIARYDPPFICKISFDTTDKDFSSYVTLMNEGTIENGDLLIVFYTEASGDAQKAYLLKGTSPCHSLDLSAYPKATKSLHPDVIATWESGWYQVTHEGYLGYSNVTKYAIYCPVGSMVYYDGYSWLSIIAEYCFTIEDMNDSSYWQCGYALTEKNVNDLIYAVTEEEKTLTAAATSYTISLSKNKELYIWLSNENNINTGSEGVLSLNLYGSTVQIGTLATDTKNILIHALSLSDDYAMIDWVYITNSSDTSTLSVEKSNGSMPLAKTTNKVILSTSAGNFSSGTTIKAWSKL